MKKYTATIIAFIVLVCAVAGLFVVLKVTNQDSGDTDPEATEATSEYMSLYGDLTFEAEDIVKLESGYGEKYAIESYTQDGETLWKCTSDENVQVETSAAESLTNNIANLKGYVINDEGDHADYGFENETSDIYIKVTLQDGRETMVYMGDLDFNQTYYYVLCEGKIFKLSSGNACYIAITKDLLVNMTIFNYDSSDVPTYFIVKQKGEKSIELTCSGYDEDNEMNMWTVKYPIERDSQSSSVDALIEAMKDITLSDVAEAGCPEEELSKYGLDVPVIEYYLQMKDSEGKKTLYLVRIGQKTADESYYYCTIDNGIDGKFDVYTVSTEYIYRTINPMDYISSYLFMKDSDYVSRVDIDIDGETHVMEYIYETEGEETITTRLFDGKEAPDDDNYCIVTSDNSFVKPTAEHDKLNNDDDITNDAVLDNPYDCFNHLLGALYKDLVLYEIDLTEPTDEQKGAIVATVTYTETDGTVTKIELYKRDNTTAYAYVNGSYAGGYCRTTDLFGDDYSNYDYVASLKALKAVMKILP